jgi:hypothetical protein
MTTEDEIRRVLHPEAHEPMRYEPRIPLGCDQQGRYPQAAEPPDWLERAEVLVVVIFFVVLIGAMVAALWGLA